MDEVPEAEANLPLNDPPAETPSDVAHDVTAASIEIPADAAGSAANAPIDPPAAAGVLPVVDAYDVDWAAVHSSVSPTAVRARMRTTVEAFEALLDRADGPGLLFDADRAEAADRAIQVSALDPAAPLWIIGDLHGDLLALEAALAVINDDQAPTASNIIFLGDFFDDEGMGLELLLRVFELILNAPDRICVVVGNHDEALSYDGNRFSSSVSPSDFTDFLNNNLAHEWIERAGKLAVRLFAHAPHALFLPDGLLVAHAGFPLSDLHARLEETGNWSDPACLSDFTWTRAHPTARRKMPNRFTRGSQFGYEDFGAFCELAARLGRPVTHMVRGHDHMEERYAIYPAYLAHPMLTTVALSRRLPRESFGPYARIPTIARFVEGSLPQVHRLHIPADIVEAVFPQPGDSHEAGEIAEGADQQ
ncbi:metallophosphoesterase [Sphingomonas endolithica]|uniref:metallophosphoesterase n=1 Tax=Sphingomonas endolithica TaxID=2972485 RepID=UPI0021AFEAB0|nr:metallophosphoesterase [Sphingomonas sp. ZFBP2030]